MAVVGGRRGAFENFGSFDRGDGQFFGGDWNVKDEVIGTFRGVIAGSQPALPPKSKSEKSRVP